jgi:hypothetical protein
MLPRILGTITPGTIKSFAILSDTVWNTSKTRISERWKDRRRVPNLAETPRTNTFCAALRHCPLSLELCQLGATGRRCESRFGGITRHFGRSGAKVERLLADARASGGAVSIPKQTMRQFVESLNTPDARGRLDRPVIDRTGLQGVYLFALPIGPMRIYKTMIEDTLEPKFVPDMSTFDVYVIDRIEKPDPN